MGFIVRGSVVVSGMSLMDYEHDQSELDSLVVQSIADATNVLTTTIAIVAAVESAVAPGNNSPARHLLQDGPDEDIYLILTYEVPTSFQPSTAPHKNFNPPLSTMAVLSKRHPSFLL